MDELRYANIALDIFSIILSVLPIVYLVSNHRYRQKLNQYFLSICISNIFMIGGRPAGLAPAHSRRSIGEKDPVCRLGGLLHCFGLCPVFFYMVRHGISANNWAGKKILLTVCAAFMQRAGRLRCDQPLYRFYLLYNG